MMMPLPPKETLFATKSDSLVAHNAFATMYQKLFLLKKSLQNHMHIELTLKDEIEHISLEIKNLQTIVALINDSIKQTQATLSLLLKNNTQSISATNNETAVHLLRNLTHTIQTSIPKISLRVCHICESLTYKSKNIKANTKKLHAIKIMASKVQKQTHMRIINPLNKTDSNAYANISHTIESILHTISYCKKLSDANASNIGKIECIAEELNMMTKMLNAHVVNFQD